MPSVLLVTAGYDHKVRLWEASTGTCNKQLNFSDSQVNCLDISPNKQYIAAAGNPHARVYDVNASSNDPLKSLDGHTHNITAVGFQKDTKWMYSGSEDGTLRIWDLRSPGTVREFGSCQREYDNGCGINAVALHPNQGELIAGDQNGNIRVFDLTQNKMSRELPSGVGSPIRSITIAADASLAATAHDNGVCVLWKLPTDGQSVARFQERCTFTAHDAYVLKCKLSPDLEYLATASADATVRLWKTEDLLGTSDESSPSPEDDGLGDDATGAEPEPEPQTMAPTTNAAPGNAPAAVVPHKQLKGHQRWVWDCCFSADSAYLVSSSSDETARLWDLAQEESIRTYSGHTKAVTAVSLNDVDTASPS